MVPDSTYHQPVMVRETIDYLLTVPGGDYVDATYGGGGHTAALLESMHGGRVLAFDKDANSEAERIDDPRVIYVEHDFIYIKQFLRYYNMVPVDGILADLGVSSHQLNQAESGFTYREDAPLDMRMDKKGGDTAEFILNNRSEDQLTVLFKRYGELKNPRKLARLIVKSRNEEPLKTTGQLKEIVKSIVPGGTRDEKVLSQAFQALRIEVNNELEHLQTFLRKSAEVLKPGGRLAILSYHSLEDRLVKHFFRFGNFSGKPEKTVYGEVLRPLDPVIRKPLSATSEEIRLNPRARSARLRVAEKRKP